MDIKKSIKKALIDNDQDQTWLGEQLDITQGGISSIVTRGHCNTKQLEKIAAAFDMKVSEFIALGE